MFVFLLFALMFSTSGAAPWSGTVLQFVPLIIEAPDVPAVSAATNACPSTPPPNHPNAVFHCYSPSDIYKAYGVDKVHAAGITGKGQTIVIVDSYGSPTALNDLTVFSHAFGLPDPDLTIIQPDGTPPFNNSVNGSAIGWAVETSLDLQWAHAIAPDAHLVLIATVPAETEDVQGFPNMLKGEEIAASLFPGSSMSQSFAATEQSFHGAGDPQVERFDETYRLAQTNHVTVFGSSGDSGTANVDKQLRVFPFPTVNWPSSDPLVTSAGGTWLQFGWTWNPTSATSLGFLTTPGSRTEAVWNENYLPAATGGGRSILFPTPGFQGGISQSILQGSRGIPDLSWNAAVNGGVLVFTSFPGVRVGWHIIGGTSASSPQLAAVIALANQKRAGLGKGPVGYLNSVLYTLSSSDFTDIVPQTFGPGAVTIGSNAQFGSGIPGMPTTTGYDLTTGLGSPKVDQFVNELAIK